MLSSRRARSALTRLHKAHVEADIRTEGVIGDQGTTGLERITRSMVPSCSPAERGRSWVTGLWAMSQLVNRPTSVSNLPYTGQGYEASRDTSPETRHPFDSSKTSREKRGRARTGSRGPRESFGPLVPATEDACRHSLLVTPMPVDAGDHALIAADEVSVGARLASLAVSPVPAGAHDRTLSECLSHGPRTGLHDL